MDVNHVTSVFQKPCLLSDMIRDRPGNQATIEVRITAPPGRDGTGLVFVESYSTLQVKGAFHLDFHGQSA